MGEMPKLSLLCSPDWEDYALLDSGEGQKLERFGAYTLVRPEHQAVWRKSFAQKNWDAAQAVFHPTGEESGGRWIFRERLPEAWQMHYKGLVFLARAGGSRHMGVFPEQAAHWDWAVDCIRSIERPVRVLNLFGYTGLATLMVAKQGASVTHVDASRKTVAQARQNQVLAGLEERAVRWIVDDVMKFIRREARRGAVYDAIILDPPKFGRGPKGEVWEFFDALPDLLEACRAILSPKPVFVVLTAYAIRASALSVHYALNEMMRGMGGSQESGELVTIERSAGRVLSMAIYSRWAREEIGLRATTGRGGF